MTSCPFSRLAHALAVAGALVIAWPALAHDSWFAPLSSDGRWLALGTGNRFPKHEVAIDARYLSAAGCRGPAGEALALKPRLLAPQSLLMQPAAAATTCWVQLQPFEIELAPGVVDLYLAEAQPEPSVRRRWVELSARGRPWIERYTKHARVVLDARAIDADVAEPLADRSAAAPALDLRLETRDPVDDGMPRAGVPLVFRLLDHGKAVTGQALELRSAAGAEGVWARTDAEGRVRMLAPTPGQWLLRGIEIRPADDRPDAWSSRFVTLAFVVRPSDDAPLRTASP